MEQTRAYSSILDQETTFLSVIGDILFLYEKERSIRGLPTAKKVQHVQLAGGLIRKDHLLIAKELFPNARLYKGYGLTECIRTAMIDSDDPAFFEDNIGRVLPGQTVEIRNERGRVLAPGQTGQIFIHGPNLMLGYQGEENSFDRKGFLATGDLGFFDEQGLLHFCGRSDDIFKTLGKKVSTVEIERAAMGLGFVELAKCIAVPCAKKGLKAVLVVQSAATTEKKKIEDLCRTVRHYLRGHLEKYKVPADVLFVDSMPRLSNQKVNRRAVYDLWLQWEAQR
jgi:acyl-CoA synthetase (AMP-forming)/AMP-acid ligase II